MSSRLDSYWHRADWPGAAATAVLCVLMFSGPLFGVLYVVGARARIALRAEVVAQKAEVARLREVLYGPVAAYQRPHVVEKDATYYSPPPNEGGTGMLVARDRLAPLRARGKEIARP